MVNSSAFAGSILLLLLPHTIQHLSSDVSSSILLLGFLYAWFRFEIGPIEDSDFEFFRINWLESGGIYELYFGEAYILSILAFAMVVASLILSTSADNKYSGYLLIMVAVILITLRFTELQDTRGFFYDNNNGISFIEIPLGFFIGLVFGVRALIQN